jgi:hypothetical protein
VQRIHLSGGTRVERHAVTTQALDAIGRVGVVEDARQHSNKEIAIRFTAPAGRITLLRDELAQLPVRLTDAAAAELAALQDDEPVAGWLVIAFVHSEDDLRVVAPAVPG